MYHLTEAHERKSVEGEGIGSLSNNLVYTKRQKDIYANRKHKTTVYALFYLDLHQTSYFDVTMHALYFFLGGKVIHL